tara:strand:- start:895 stop:1035 length:141 start_codon:yes stop_codon:yes gene_type:complete
MSNSTIIIFTLALSIFFYIVFLVIGVGGIRKNKVAQGLDVNSKKKI